MERDAVTTVHGNVFDLNNKSYYMLLGSGTLTKGTGIGYHDYAYIVSDKKVKFNK